jgi:two-component system, chemotaxis family, protein-glutamate methylesterase/glutaminase
MKKIRVLVVDDSAIVRKILMEALSSSSDIEVVGSAPDAYVARDKILSLKPDVLTLDIEMPRMDGLTFLGKLMRFHPMPAVIVSSLGQASCLAAIHALELGAVDVLAKPGGPYSVAEMRESLVRTVRAAAGARVRGALTVKSTGPAIVSNVSPSTVIAIGASTGGIDAVTAVLTKLPASSPGILVTQHIPSYFSRAFAARLNEQCALQVKEAEDGDPLLPGAVLIAPGDFHMVLRKVAGRYFVNVLGGPRICYQRPSVDVLFQSVAAAAAAEAIGVILTGMGNDGAQGLLQMRRAGARTIAQDEASCVVFGMPREAFLAGAAEQVLPLSAIAAAILNVRH